jgi:hypothetical protein
MNRYLLAQVDIGKNLSDGNGGNIGSKYTSISPLLSALLKNSLTLASIILLCLLLFGGVGLITSAGANDPKKAAQSQKTVTSALIGFAVVFCAFFIIQIISYITGVDILNSSL